MKKKHLKILQDIQNSIPKELLDNLMVKSPLTPTMKEAHLRALDDPEVDEKTKYRLKLVLDSGALDREVEDVNPEVEAKIDDYINTKIDEAIKRGDLPKRPELSKKARKLINKRKKHEQEKRNQEDNRVDEAGHDSQGSSEASPVSSN